MHHLRRNTAIREHKSAYVVQTSLPACLSCVLIPRRSETVKSFIFGEISLIIEELTMANKLLPQSMSSGTISRTIETLFIGRNYLNGRCRRISVDKIE